MTVPQNATAQTLRANETLTAPDLTTPVKIEIETATAIGETAIVAALVRGTLSAAASDLALGTVTVIEKVVDLGMNEMAQGTDASTDVAAGAEVGAGAERETDSTGLDEVSIPYHNADF